MWNPYSNSKGLSAVPAGPVQCPFLSLSVILFLLPSDVAIQ